jgi:hypothetical protein
MAVNISLTLTAHNTRNRTDMQSQRPPAEAAPETQAARFRQRRKEQRQWA